jgi:hypothetical protein
MKKLTKKELIEIIKSGNFTVYYHDNGSSNIYEGKYTEEYFDELIEENKFDDFDDENNIFISSFDGYYTEDLALLIKALGGNLLCV